MQALQFLQPALTNVQRYDIDKPICFIDL